MKLPFVQRAWYKNGRLEAYMKKENLNETDIRQNFKDFSTSPVCIQLLLAMDDFAEETDIEWMFLSASDPAYDKKMAALQQKRKFKTWFKALVADFVGLEKSSKDGRASSIRKYIDGVKKDE